MPNGKTSADASIEDGFMVIRIPIEVLPQVVRGGCDSLNGIEPRMYVTDPMAFAKEIVRELNREDEIGTTRVHKMFDGAIVEAFNQGAEGIEKDRRDEDRRCYHQNDRTTFIRDGQPGTFLDARSGDRRLNNV